MMRIEHPAGAALSVPDGWESAAAPEHDAVVGLEGPGAAFRATVVLMATRTDDPDEVWARDTERLADALRDHVLLDEDFAVVGGRPARIRLVHHVGPAGEALVMKQWSVAARDVVWTLTATIDAPRWTTSAAALEEIAGTLTVPGDPT